MQYHTFSKGSQFDELAGQGKKHKSSWFVKRENVYSVAVYKKISNDVERMDNFRALARKLSFLPKELDIFDIRQHYIRILFIFQRLICCVLLFQISTNMN